MQTTQLELETVTPMFLHGHDNGIVELRPPPFKSLFRYWWRAVQDCDWKSLQKEEAELFGSTSGRAPLSVRIPEKTNRLGKPIQYSPLPHKNTFRTEAYDVGKQFNLQLITKNTSDASNYKQIAKLAFLLGGVGNRSRRGFGSLRETRWNFTGVSDLQDEILATLNAIVGHDRFRINSKFLINSQRIQIIELPRSTHYPPEYPIIRRIFFGQTPCTVKNLLMKIGQMTHKHKVYRNNALGYAERDGRFASPLHVHIQRVNADYLPIVTQFYPVYPGATPQDIQSSNLFQRQKKFISDIIK